MRTIHLHIGEDKTKCGAKNRGRWVFLPMTNETSIVNCRNCNGTRRVSDFPRDTRSATIKAIIKKEFPKATVKVKIDKYSMGESINISTDLIQWKERDDKSMRKTEESQENESTIKDLLRKFESVDRDQYGEILSGGNTFLFIGSIDRPGWI